MLEGEENFQSKEHNEESKEEVYRRGKYVSAWGLVSRMQIELKNKSLGEKKNANGLEIVFKAFSTLTHLENKHYITLRLNHTQ